MAARFVAHRTIGTALVTLAAVIGLATAANAQEAPSSDPQFAALAEKLKRGDSVKVIDIAGQEVKGHLAEVSAEGIMVLAGEEHHTIPAARVQRVERKRVGVLLGAIIGAGVGVACGAALASYARNEGGNTALAFTFPVAVGLGTGVAIDALVNFPRTVYKRPAGTRITAAPIIGPGTTGAAVRVTF